MTIIVEPYGCWQNRMIEQRLRAEEEARRRYIGLLHPIQAELMHIVAEHDEPIRDTTLAHAFAKIPGYRNRQQRDCWIKTAWPPHLATPSSCKCCRRASPPWRLSPGSWMPN
jgi:hypothetical protein